MGRILRIELRRSAAVGIALLSLVAGTAVLLPFSAGIAWMQLAVGARILLMVLCPLVLAGGAWLGQRDARSRVGELFASTVRPRWQRILPTAGALAVTVLTAYTLMFLIVTAWVAPTLGYFPITAIAVTAVGGLSLVAAGWLGMAVGRAVPRLATAPALAVVGFAVVGFLPEWLTSVNLSQSRPVPAALLLVPVYTGPLDDFETIVAGVNLVQALWLAAVAATGLLLMGAVRRRAVALALLPAVLGAAATVPLLPGDSYAGAFAIDREAVALVCDDDSRQVCMTRVHSSLLPDVVGPARQALTTMAAKLPNAPTRAMESGQVASWAWSSPTAVRPAHPADTLVFELPGLEPNGRHDLGDRFLLTLFAAAWRLECDDRSVHTDTHLTQLVGAHWLAGHTEMQFEWLPYDPEQTERVLQNLISLPPEEQGRRMAAARDAALDCRPEAVETILLEDSP